MRSAADVACLCLLHRLAVCSNTWSRHGWRLASVTILHHWLSCLLDWCGLLVFGQQISHMFRCARIQGLDTAEGLLLFGREHFYIIDGFTLLRTKEIKDIDSLPYEWVRLIFCANVCRVHCRKQLHTEILDHIPHKPKTEWDLECSFICWFVFYWGSKFKRKSNNNVSSNSKKNGNVDSTLKGLTSMHLLLWILL